MVTLIITFVLGIASSLFATWIVMGRERLRFRLSFRAVRRLILRLDRDLKSASYAPDVVVSIDRNGTIVGTILASCFGLHAPISVATDNLRLPDGGRAVAIPAEYSANLTNLAGMRVLVVICCNETGTSLGHVVSQLRNSPTPPTEIRTCALFSSVSPAHRPDYVAAIVGRDIKKPMNEILRGLPWVTSQWHYQLASERAPRHG